VTTFFTSDLHVGHANICAYTGRPYSSVEDMNAGLIEAWAETVGADDEVWILGDLALGRISETLPLVSALSGHKILVPGNHDRCWAGASDPARWRDVYLQQAGIEAIVDAPASYRLPDGTVCALDHFPYAGDSQDTDRYGAWRPSDNGRWLLHGHVHTAWRQRGRQINVGVDAWGGRPVPVATIGELVAAGTGDLDPLPWV